MNKQTQNYIDSQQHWEDRINDDYYLQKQIDKQMEKDIEKQIYNEWEKQNKIIIPQEEPKQENCCTPANQIKRYVDCKGCDRKPKKISKQTAVEWLVEQYTQGNYTWEAYKQAKEIEKEQSQNYAIFAIRCDRTQMRILDFNDYIKLEENENQ
jgi:hypothetical protein